MGVRMVPAETLHDTERNTPDGKTSSVHFLIFNFSDEDVAAFRDDGQRVTLEIEHENYGHGAAIAGAARASLSADFD